MRVIRKIVLLALIIASLSAQNAFAALVNSSYADAVGNWQGSTYYNRNVVDDIYLRGRIDFAVYDTTMVTTSAEQAFFDDIALVLSDLDQYLYAYQVFNDEVFSDADLIYFAVFNEQQTTLALNEDQIGSQDDGGGIQPTDEGLSSDQTRVVWDFTDGLVYKDDHSWFLAFTSDIAPVIGDYEVKALNL